MRVDNENGIMEQSDKNFMQIYRKNKFCMEKGVLMQIFHFFAKFPCFFNFVYNR